MREMSDEETIELVKKIEAILPDDVIVADALALLCGIMVDMAQFAGMSKLSFIACIIISWDERAKERRNDARRHH